MRNRLALGVAVLSASAALLASQQPPPAQTPPPAATPAPPHTAPTFNSGVEILRLHVSLLDSGRVPVTGRTAMDFMVLEEGKPHNSFVDPLYGAVAKSYAFNPRGTYSDLSFNGLVESVEALLDAYVATLGEDLPIPYSMQLNPPLWELGHVRGFQDWWIGRNPERALGVAGDPDHPRPAGRLPGADELYNSSLIAHTRRWHLPLPDLAATRVYLAEGLAETLDLLAEAEESDAGLYFYRLALFHEDMHAEAATYMAQALDIPLMSLGLSQ